MNWIRNKTRKSRRYIGKYGFISWIKFLSERYISSLATGIEITQIGRNDSKTEQRRNRI